MTIPLTGAGSLFVRLGHHGGLANSLNTYRGTTAPGKITTIAGDYLTTDRKYVDGLIAAQNAWQAANKSFLTYLQTLARSTMIGMADADQRQPTNSLSRSIAYLVAQMTASADSVKRATVGASSSTGRADGTSNQGNAVLVLSTKARTGVPLENLIAETIYLTCSADSQSATAVGSERLTVAGMRRQSDPLAWDWPAGSGASGSLTVVDPTLDAQSSGNLLKNSDFETFTVANTPDNWDVSAATPGTTLFSDASNQLFGSKCLKITGTGAAQLTTITQHFNVSSNGTSIALEPLTQYPINLWTKVSAVPATGVLRAALWDGSAVVNDAAGTANSFTIALTGETTSYAAHSGSFRTPAVLPANLYLQLKLTTALENGKSAYLDGLGLAVGTPLYQQGLYCNVFRGANKLIISDRYAIATTNDYGGASVGASFQSLFDRFFNMRGLGQLLPSASSPTISDGLIT